MSVNPSVKMLSLKFKERSEALGYKGKKRDDAALDYFAGAATAMFAADHPDAQSVATFLQFMLAPRGYLAFVEVSQDADPPVA